ncbi:MAG: hypothetical protein K6G92_11590 [Bacteroidaceae bacterium]|nr:hypothetical protein [Bacteroidaceae bacterium]
MKKGLERTFLEYGIRQTDLQVIAELCDKHELDADWLKEQILKRYHEAKVDRIEMDDSATEKVIDKALKELKS